MSEQSVSTQFLQFAGLVTPNLPRNIRPERLKYYTENGRSELKERLRAAFADDLVQSEIEAAERPRIELISSPQVPVLHTAEESATLFAWLDHWKLFCTEFKLKQEIDFEAAKEKALTRPKGFDWVIYTPSGFTARDAIDRLCTPQFAVHESLAVEKYSLEREPDKARLILCRPNIEPDSKWRVSSDTMAATTVPFLDCRECYILEGFYYHLTKKPLNLKGWTRCPRSRASRREVASVYWDETCGKFCAGDVGPRDDGPRGGGREAVILKA